MAGKDSHHGNGSGQGIAHRKQNTNGIVEQITAERCAGSSNVGAWNVFMVHLGVHDI